MQFAYEAIVSFRIASRRHHIHLLVKVPVEKHIVDVELQKRLRKSRGNGNKDTHCNCLGYRRETVEVIDTFNLVISLGNKSRLVSVNDPSGFNLTL